ncbi:putative zinc transporter 6 [Iris pallida]|uniref:Zinc transporter 6 n=1 Tax=Iris pallida TaxID=29817 RepID=A0AAX6FSM2_IRIPA|nr:putative zinc transporter 6 [Iris pallida]
MAGCTVSSSSDLTRASWCRNGPAATHLKLVSLAVIFVTSAVGITLPVFLSRMFHGKKSYADSLHLIKCFAAGVILSTSLVHVLPDASSALSDCQLSSRHPWRDFPFSGFVSLVGSLLSLLVDVVASEHLLATENTTATSTSSTKHSSNSYERIGKVEEEVVVVSVGCHGSQKALELEVEGGGGEEEERMVRMKQRMVSQVLEIGIIFHSVIIGVTMGMSQNRCTIRPLVAALSFHQIFEGMGLGGCIAQAGFGMKTVGYMCLMFSATTPLGILMGMMIFYMTGYNDSSPNALIFEGLLGSLSSGILVYMALVDLIAVDFFHNKAMASNPRLKKISYVVLVLGSASMSVLALWA